MRYLPLSDADRSEMLLVIGAPSVDDLFRDVPEEARLNGPIEGLPMHASEMAVERHMTALSRKNILMRDRYTCQYCHRTPPGVELTLDHVIPRSRAGETTWENLVACCHGCNNKKGNRTPEEAGLKLTRAPRPFSLHTSRHLMRLLGKSDDQWRKYLFY